MLIPDPTAKLPEVVPRASQVRDRDLANGPFLNLDVEGDLCVWRFCLEVTFCVLPDVFDQWAAGWEGATVEPARPQTGG